MDWLARILFLGIALTGIGAVLLGGLAYGDFKKRGLIRQANGALSGTLLLFLGFLIAAGYLCLADWQVDCGYSTNNYWDCGRFGGVDNCASDSPFKGSLTSVLYILGYF